MFLIIVISAVAETLVHNHCIVVFPSHFSPMNANSTPQITMNSALRSHCHLSLLSSNSTMLSITDTTIRGPVAMIISACKLTHRIGFESSRSLTMVSFHPMVRMIGAQLMLQMTTASELIFICYFLFMSSWYLSPARRFFVCRPFLTSFPSPDPIYRPTIVQLIIPVVVSAIASLSREGARRLRSSTCRVGVGAVFVRLVSGCGLALGAWFWSLCLDDVSFELFLIW